MERLFPAGAILCVALVNIAFGDSLVGFAIFAIGVIVLAMSFTVVAPETYGYVYFLGAGEAHRSMKEGLNIIWPFFERVLGFSAMPGPVEIRVSVQSNEASETSGVNDDSSSMTIVISGLAMIRVDIGLLDVRRQWTDVNIRKGLEGKIRQELGIISGKTKGFDFVRMHEEISLIINSLLRLKNVPHLNPRLINSSYVAGSEVPPEERISFYRDKGNKAKIKEFLKEEGGNPEERSEAEEMYGVDIMEFTLDPPDFTDEMKKGLEARNIAGKLAKGLEETDNQKLKIAKRWKRFGVTPEKAADEAGLAVGQGEKKIISVSGLPEAATAIVKAIKGGS